MTDSATFELILRLCVAAALGGLLGLEREMHGRPAGLRTHLLVSLGAASFMVLSLSVANLNGMFVGDPSRIAAQIVTGIGFLGAGAILKEGVTVRGLTTAACLWIAAAIGMSAGAGHYVVAILAFTLTLGALLLLPYLERLLKKHSYRILEIVSSLEMDVGAVISAVKAQGVHVLRCDIDRNYTSNRLTTTLLIRLFHNGVTDKRAHGIIGAIEALDIALERISWRGP